MLEPLQVRCDCCQKEYSLGDVHDCKAKSNCYLDFLEMKKETLVEEFRSPMAKMVYNLLKMRT